MSITMKTAFTSLMQSLVHGAHRDPDTMREPRADTWSAGRPGPQQSETSPARMVVSRCTAVYIILLVLNLCSPPETRSQESTRDLKRPNLTGHVKAGDKIPKATVFIFTAGPKVGTSTFCPSCYADCRKSAKSDAEGAFEIESLDPQLLFRILVVAKGYKPKFVPKVDPATGPLSIDMDPVELREVTPDRSIRGRVIDSKGKPIVGAVVEAHGIRKKNDVGTMWGMLPGVDPVAVTDDEGDFLITSREPFEALDVRVEARAFAHKQFNKLASGETRHDLTMAEGATVEGRVMFGGKGVAGVSVGMVGSDRGVESYAGNFDVGTASDGRFTFVNLPPNTEYFIYGLMNTIKTNGAIAIRKVHTGEDGATLDVGDLNVEPAQRLAGRVVCADAQPVPPKTRLLIGRDQAWDTLQLDLDKDGRFATTGIPKETLSLSVRIEGYHPSPKNLSLDLLNPFHLIGRVDRDITNLVFLLEKGPELRSEFDSQLPESEWPQNRPLRGAESAPDHADQYIVSGHVLDADTKELIPEFFLTPGNAAGAPWGHISWSKRNSVTGTNGNYLIFLDKKYAQPVLKGEAEGYLPGKFTMLPQSRTNFVLTLRKGSGPTGTVFLPDGQAAQGVSVALVIAAENELSLRGDGTLQAWQHRDLIQLTDPDGSFSFKPDLDLKAVAATDKEGFKWVSIDELATNPKVVLEPWGRIEGVLYRAENLSTNEDVDLAFQDGPSINLQYHTMTDGQGRFEFAHVPPGRLQINGRNMVSERGWTWDPLQSITVKPGEDLKLDIHADARAPKQPFPGPANRPKLVRKNEPGPSGKVLLPNGKPAADAEIALMVKDQYIAVGRGSLRAYEARQEGLVVRADAAGRFSLPSVEGATGLLAVHEQGYAHVALLKLGNSPEITLEPWGQIQGTLHVGRRLGTNEQVSLQNANFGFGTSPMLAAEDYRAQTDEFGKFLIRYVPPGEQKISRMVPFGNGSYQSSSGTPITVKPGVVTEVSLGGDGQTVLGKVHITGYNGKFQNIHASLHNQFPDVFKKSRTPEQQAAWFATPEAKLAMKDFRSYTVIIDEGGSFQIEEVLPGKYELEIMMMSAGGPPIDPSGIRGRYHRQIVIPSSENKEMPPVDVGTIECEPVQEAANK